MMDLHNNDAVYGVMKGFGAVLLCYIATISALVRVRVRARACWCQHQPLDSRTGHNIAPFYSTSRKIRVHLTTPRPNTNDAPPAPAPPSTKPINPNHLQDNNNGRRSPSHARRPNGSRPQRPRRRSLRRLRPLLPRLPRRSTPSSKTILLRSGRMSTVLCLVSLLSRNTHMG
jgi:hypothetical protein